MTNSSSTEPLLEASRTIGADGVFWQTVQLVAKECGAADPDEPAVRQRLAALHEQFARDCATVLDRHLGREQAVRSAAALASTPLQGFLAARSKMAPALAQQLQSLRKQIAELDL